jgi:SAM-dependent methyltransferase
LKILNFFWTFFILANHLILYNMSDPSPSYYIHGSSPEEQQRLSKLNDILNEGCLRELNLQGGERILDVGSGLGQFTRQMGRAAGAGGYVLGIERDPEQLKSARQLAAGAGESQLVHFRRGDALRLPLEAGEWNSFDIAHSRFVLEHISRPGQVIEQMRQALRPGGRLIVSDDDHTSFQPTPEPPGFSYVWQAYLRSYDRAGNDPHIGRRLVTLLHHAGLKDISNTIVFFGGCAGQPLFPAVADNLIGILIGARDFMLEQQLIDPDSFDRAIDGLHTWKNLPDAALWYGVYWAEGRK